MFFFCKLDFGTEISLAVFYWITILSIGVVPVRSAAARVVSMWIQGSTLCSEAPAVYTLRGGQRCAGRRRWSAANAGRRLGSGVPGHWLCRAPANSVGCRGCGARLGASCHSAVGRLPQRCFSCDPSFPGVHLRLCSVNRQLTSCRSMQPSICWALTCRSAITVQLFCRRVEYRKSKTPQQLHLCWRMQFCAQLRKVCCRRLSCPLWLPGVWLRCRLGRRRRWQRLCPCCIIWWILSDLVALLLQSSRCTHKPWRL